MSIASDRTATKAPWRGIVPTVVVILFFGGAANVVAQNVETDPLQCWWRTSTGSVRIAEPFTAVLTCAVIETDDVKVIIDESRLDPSVAQFAPFEVLGGSHAADLRSGDRRFFQYEYRMRLMAENMFGKDVALPETKLTYRIQSKVSQKAAVEGRDQSYLLPPLSMRVLSLVPNDASDIRDASAETFADVDRRSFRANLLVVIGGVLFALAGLIAVLAVVRLIMLTRKPTAAADRLVGDGAILRGVGREIAAVQRQREDGGWTQELAARALAALRIVAAYALGRPAARAIVARRQAEADAPATSNGAIVVANGWPKRKYIAVSGAATARDIASVIKHSTNGRRPGELESIEEALSRFTAAQYGRADDGRKLDDAALDESLAAGKDVLGRLKIEQSWLMKRLGRSRKPAAAESRVWSH
jgi:hypothetical protein